MNQAVLLFVKWLLCGQWQQSLHQTAAICNVAI
jgi:hypothetical protein